METSVQQTPAAGVQSMAQYDVIIIGAGLTGLHQLYRIRQLGLSVRVFEDGGGVGGTWYWNRYPGCRLDSESETYSYSWSDELLQEWDWKEHFSSQVDNERYYNHVADKFDLRRDIQLNTRVKSAVYDEKANRWELELESGQRACAQYVVAAVGTLSARHVPDTPGIASFKGETYHTGNWPHEKVSFAGKRVACIGTGATGVQFVQTVAKEARHLTVFQRTANYCAPLRNSPITPEEQKKIKASYKEIFSKCSRTPIGYEYGFDRRSAMDVPREERLARYEELWAKPGFEKWLGNYHDIMTNPEANEDFAEFVRGKIRARVKDPVVAEKLVPRSHPFGSKRIPLETDYYEAYNQDNVLLVDLNEAPIESITPKGIRTRNKEYEFDIIVYATGFDAVTGPLTRIDIRGEGGQTIKDKWADGPRTYLGLLAAGFPNFFIANIAAFCNYPRCSETVVEWIANCIGFMRTERLNRIVPTPQAEEAWVDLVSAQAEGMLFAEGNSWFVGANIPGKKRVFLLFSDTAPAYRRKIAAVAADKYVGFALG